MVSLKVLVVLLLVASASATHIGSRKHKGLGKYHNTLKTSLGYLFKGFLGHNKLKETASVKSLIDLEPPTSFSAAIDVNVQLVNGCGALLNTSVSGFGDFLIRIYLAFVKITVCLLGKSNCHVCQDSLKIQSGQDSIAAIIAEYKLENCSEDLEALIKQNGGEEKLSVSAGLALKKIRYLAGLINLKSKITVDLFGAATLNLYAIVGAFGNSYNGKNILGTDIYVSLINVCGPYFRDNGYSGVDVDAGAKLSAEIDIGGKDNASWAVNDTDYVSPSKDSDDDSDDQSADENESSDDNKGGKQSGSGDDNKGGKKTGSGDENDKNSGSGKGGKEKSGTGKTGSNSNNSDDSQNKDQGSRGGRRGGRSGSGLGIRINAGIDLGAALSSLFKPIAGVLNLAESIISGILNFGRVTNINSVFEISFRVSAGCGQIIDASFISGLGDLFQRIFAAIIRITVCIDANVDCDFCNGDVLGVGRVSQRSDVITKYKLKNCKSQVLELIRGSGKDINDYDGSLADLLNIILNLSVFVDNYDNLSKDDFSKASIQVYGALGIIGNSYSGNDDDAVGSDVCGALITDCSKQLQDNGFRGYNDDEIASVSVQLEAAVKFGNAPWRK